MEEAPVAYTRRKDALVVVAMLVWMWSMGATGRAPMAIALLALAALALFDYKSSGSRIYISQETRSRWRAFWRKPDYYLPGLLMLSYLMALIWCDDRSFVQRRVQLSAQAFGIPAIFWLLQSTLVRYKRCLWLAFVTFAAVLAVVAMGYATVNHEAFMVALGKGRVVPTPISHVRFAMLCAMAAVVGLWQGLSGIVERDRQLATSVCFLVLGVLLTVALHVIAVRTGLATLYLGGAIMVVRLVVTRLRWWQGLGALTVVTIGLSVLVSTTPTLIRKLNFMRYDLEQLDTDDGTAYSDVGRLASMQAAWDIVRADPWLGSGETGLRQAMRDRYAAMEMSELELLPHNQFLFSWGAAGIGGLVGVFAVLLAPAFRQNWLRQPLVLELVVMVAVVCFVEAPLESDIAVGLSMLGVWLAKVEGDSGRMCGGWRR